VPIRRLKPAGGQPGFIAQMAQPSRTGVWLAGVRLKSNAGGLVSGFFMVLREVVNAVVARLSEQRS
jgi:hypothetical protein